MDLVKCEKAPACLKGSDLVDEARRVWTTWKKSWYTFGTLIRQIREQRAYLDVGYTSFEAFVEQEFDFSVRKAQLLVRAIEVFLECRQDPTKVQPNQAYLLGRYMTPKNAKDLCVYAADHGCVELKEYMVEKGVIEHPVTYPVQICFHEKKDRDFFLKVLEMAKWKADTESQTVAAICMAEEFDGTYGGEYAMRGKNEDQRRGKA